MLFATASSQAARGGHLPRETPENDMSPDQVREGVSLGTYIREGRCVVVCFSSSHIQLSFYEPSRVTLPLYNGPVRDRDVLARA